MSNNIEIPGPTRKVPPKHTTLGDTNEVVGKNSNYKNQMTTLRETLPTKNNFPLDDDDDDNYSLGEDDDDGDIGKRSIRHARIFHLIYFFIV